MTLRYFDLAEDVYIPGRWELGKIADAQGKEVWPWLLMRGEPTAFTGQPTVPVRAPGNPLGFTHAAFGIPIVDARVASIFAELAPNDVQLIPVNVQGHPEQYFILNAIKVIQCIDDQASEEVQYWTEEDGLPEQVGTYSAVSGMRIDPTKVGDAKVFRTWGWTVALIVSGDVKEALEHAGVTGMEFEEVTGPRSTASDEDSISQKHLERLKQLDVARDAAWSSLGQLEAASIIPIVPFGPLWPGHRQAWRVIHRDNGNTLLVTDGLSDPFIDRDEPSAGLGLELVIETSEPLSEVRGSWPLRLLQAVTDEVVEHANVRAWLHKGLMSMEVPGEDLPDSLVTREGRVGVLLGLESSTLPRRISTPAGDVLLVTVKALLPAELAFMLRQGRAGPGELARRFAEAGDAHVSRSWRKPIVS
jgi:hypothetical protein